MSRGTCVVCRAVVWQLCGGVRGREAWRVACVSAGRREESREIQILPPRGRTSSEGFLAPGFQLTSPPTAKSTQAVTSGQSQLAFAFLGGSHHRTNESNPQLSKACQPCTSAPQPCASAAQPHAPPPLPPRTPVHAPSRTALRAVSHASRLVLRRPLSHHLPEGFCTLNIASAPATEFRVHHTPWQTFAHNRSEAYNFCSSLPHDARPHLQACRHPLLAPDEGDSHLQHRRAPTRRAHPLPQEEACTDQDQLHPSAQVARRLLRAGQRRRRRSGAS